jgi:hypothetical protein
MIAHLNKSAGRYVTPLGLIFLPLTLSQPVFALTFNCCMISRRAADTNFTYPWFNLTWVHPESMTYQTPSNHANHYTTGSLFIY